MEGYRAIGQIIQKAPNRIIEIISIEGAKNLDKLDYPRRLLTHAQFRTIALSRHPSGPLAIVTLPQGWDSSKLPDKPGKKILVLEDIQDPGNIGSLVRSAAAFDFSGILLSQKCADPFAPKSTQASCGAIVSLWLRRTQFYREIVKNLKKGGFCIIAADPGGKMLKNRERAPKNLALILGNEGNGLMDETMRLANEIVKIPFNDKNVESLNVAACGAICMYMFSSYRNTSTAFIF